MRGMRYDYGIRTSIHIYIYIYIYTAPARIFTPLIVSRSLCSLANYLSIGSSYVLKSTRAKYARTQTKLTRAEKVLASSAATPNVLERLNAPLGFSLSSQWRKSEDKEKPEWDIRGRQEKPWVGEVEDKEKPKWEKRKTRRSPREKKNFLSPSDFTLYSSLVSGFLPRLPPR